MHENWNIQNNGSILYSDHHSEQMIPDGVIERLRMARKTWWEIPSTELSC
jgi:hypothetical protein